MPHLIARSLNTRRPSSLFTLFALLSLLGLTAGSLNLFQPTAHAVGGNVQSNALGLSNAVAVNPGTLAFSSSSYKATEVAGSATVTVKRTGGTDNQVVGAITLNDVTTSPADYRFTLGAKDTTFNPAAAGADGFVESMAVQPDGKLIIGGNFTEYNLDPRAPNRVMRLNADGTRDTTFNLSETGANSFVKTIALQPDGKIVIGGSFTEYNGDTAAPNYVMRLNADGTRDITFNPGGVGLGSSVNETTVNAVAVQPDGKIVVGGQFTNFDGVESAPDYIIRLNADGTRDMSFNPGGSGTDQIVLGVSVQPDGKILVGGSFNSYNWDYAASNYLLRLNTDGTLDNTFNPGGAGAGSSVYATAVLPDGKLIIVGSFKDYNGDATLPDRVMRLNADGTPDATFNPSGAGASGTFIFDAVKDVAVQPDGKLIIGGEFNSYNGNASAPDNIMRLNADGTPDTAFNAGGTGANNAVYALAMQSDGKIVIGGLLNNYNGGSAPGSVMGLVGTPFVTWQTGDATDKLFQLPIVNDGIVETDETLTLTLAVVSGGATLGSPSSATLTIGKGEQTITFNTHAPATAAYNTSFTVAATSNSGLPVSYSSAGACTNVGALFTMNSGTGTCTVKADQAGDNDYNPAAQVTESVTAEKAAQFMVFNTSATRTYGDADFTVEATASSGLAVSFAVNGQCTIIGSTVHLTGAGSCTVTASQAGNANYAAAPSVPQTFNINKAGTTTNVSVSNATYDGQPHGGSAVVTGFGGLNQSLSVTYAGRNGTSYPSTTTAPTDAGDYTASASYGGDTDHTGSSDSKNFQIAKVSQTITFGALADKTFGNPDFALSATASSGLTVTFSSSGNCSVNGGNVHLAGAGSCTITASQAGTANYNAAPDVQRTFQIAKAATTTTVSTSANPAASGQSVTFTASVNSAAGTPNGSVQFKVDDADLGTPVALGNGGTASISSSPLAQGSHTVTAIYSGDTNYAASNGALANGGQWALTFNVALSFKSEGNEPNDLDFLVSLSPACTLPVTVNYATADGTAVAPSDYDATSGQLFFLPGDTSKRFSVRINGDTTYEESEEFFIDVSLPGNTQVARGRGIIMNDDPTGGVIEFEQAAYDVAEGGSLTVKVKRTLYSNLPVDVDYATDDGSVPSVAVPCSATTGLALDRCDFTKALGTLHFASGETEKTFKLLISDDSYVEGAETLQLKLSNPAGNAALGPKSTAFVNIDDDSPEINVNPIDDTNNFVKQQYLDFLSRDPDASGFQFWTSGINACGANAVCREVKRIDTSAAFFFSIEFQETGYLVYRAHKVAYGDATSPNVTGTVPVVRLNEFLPDTQRIGQDVVVGAGAWQQQLEANKEAYVLEFVGRPRFLSAFPTTLTASEFVAKLDQNAGGVLSEDEKTQLVSVLGTAPANAGKRAAALRQVAEHTLLRQREFTRAFVLMQFYGYLRRNPDDAPDADFRGWKFWLDKLEQFGGDYRRAEMVKAFLSSDEYRKRFGQ